MNKNLLWAMMPLMTACGNQQEAQKPNIIYIMCDDLDIMTWLAMASSISIPRTSTVWLARECALPKPMPVAR